MTKKLLPILLIGATFINLIAVRPAMATNPPILITEVQTGLIDGAGVESPRSEFIELTNVSGVPLSLDGWFIEYLSAANDGSIAATSQIKNIRGQTYSNGQFLLTHNGYILPGADDEFGVDDTSSSGLLAKSGGHIRLMNGSYVVDCVSWGSAVAIPNCDKVSATAPAGYTLQRQLTNGSYDKSTGVVNLSPATPQGSDPYQDPTSPPPGPTNDASTCENVELSEIVANPAGDDALGEYIELHNKSSDNQTLNGCVLKLNNGKEYTFGTTDNLEADQYRAFYYDQTGLQLSNSGATVTLVLASQQQSATYPVVSDDQAWAWIGGIWTLTSRPTPDVANSLLVPLGDETPIEVMTSNECPDGKHRNATTGRCRNIEVTTATAACADDQVRNPATGRCRKITTAAIQTACQPDQEINPTSGRCRKKEAAATQKACAAGQERSTETGRCRKIVSKPKVLGLGTGNGKYTYHFMILGAVLMLILGYGIYEYRNEIGGWFNRVKKWLPVFKTE